MRRLLDKTRWLIAALLFAALVIVPTIDAFACGIEPAVSIDAGPRQPGHDDGAGDHQLGVCGHNHCHHVSVNLLPDPHGLGNGVCGQGPAESLRAFALSDITDNLMRPPRA